MPSFHLRPTALCAAVCLALTVEPALAQPAAAPAAFAAIHDYQLPAAPLGQTLRSIARQSGRTIVADPALVDGKTALAISGRYTAEAAAQRALIGSGLELSITASGALTVRVAVKTDGATVLSALRVGATVGEPTAWSPVYGVVAKRSAAGTKTDMPLIEMPQSVSVVTREQIEAQNADSLDQSFDYTPGIFSLGGGSNRRGSTGFTVRGFNVTGSAPLYVNGSKFPINSLSGAAEPFNYERIELVKGPASILYGQAAPGGIINLVTKRPTPEPLRELGVEIGSFDWKQMTADFGGPIDGDGHWGYRVTGLVRDADTMIDNIPDDRVAISPTVVWRPSDSTTLTLLASYYENETVYDYGKPFQGTALPNPNGKIKPDRFVGEPHFNRFDTTGYTVGYLFEHAFTEQLQFRQNVLYFDYDSDYRDISTGALSADGRRVSRSAYTRDDEDYGYSIDNQLQYKLQTGRLAQTFLVGVDYSWREFDRLQRNGTVGSLDLYAPVYGSAVVINPTPSSHSVTESIQTGIYVQDHIKFDEHWVLLLGGRWDDAENEAKNQLNGSKTKTDADAFTGRVGLMYLSDSGFAPYISYSESFQPASGTDYFGKTFDPTTGEQYEAGIKYEPNNVNASVTLSVYELTQQNVTTPDVEHRDCVRYPTTCGNFSEQTGEVRSRGVELEARASLADNLNLIGAYTKTDTEITESNGPDLGRKLWSAPEDTASLWVDYTLAGGPADGLGLAAGVRYVGHSYNIDNSIKVDDYTLLDLAVRYQLEQWRFALNVKNALDKEYIASCTFACFYGDERTVNLSAKYSW